MATKRKAADEMELAAIKLLAARRRADALNASISHLQSELEAASAEAASTTAVVEKLAAERCKSKMAAVWSHVFTSGDLVLFVHAVPKAAGVAVTVDCRRSVDVRNRVPDVASATCECGDPECTRPSL